jgi:hypothetical protein
MGSGILPKIGAIRGIITKEKQRYIPRKRKVFMAREVLFFGCFNRINLNKGRLNNKMIPPIWVKTVSKIKSRIKPAIRINIISE